MTDITIWIRLLVISNFLVLAAQSWNWAVKRAKQNKKAKRTQCYYVDDIFDGKIRIRKGGK